MNILDDLMSQTTANHSTSLVLWRHHVIVYLMSMTTYLSNLRASSISTIVAKLVDSLIIKTQMQQQACLEREDAKMRRCVTNSCEEL